VCVSLLAGVLGGPNEIGTALTVVCVTASLLCAATYAWGRSHFPPNAVG
jgi:hypothetical protein